ERHLLLAHVCRQPARDSRLAHAHTVMLRARDDDRPATQLRQRPHRMPTICTSERGALGGRRDRSAANSIATRLARRLAGRAISVVRRMARGLDVGGGRRTSAVAYLARSSCGSSGQPEPIDGPVASGGADPGAQFTGRVCAIQRVPSHQAAISQLVGEFLRLLSIHFGPAEEAGGSRFVELPAAFEADEVFAFRHDFRQLLALGAVKRKHILFVHGWPSSRESIVLQPNSTSLSVCGPAVYYGFNV